ncbi:MAG: glycosyltransferase [Bacteroidota bacterium]
MTSFNRPALLREAVRSVRAQTYRNLEIIVV